VESKQVKKLLLSERRVQEVVGLWNKIDIALMSIGVISCDTGLYYSFPDPANECERMQNLGAVGDLLAKPFDSRGRFLGSDFLQRMIAIDSKDLRRIPIVAGIAGGRQKVQAILGALRTECLNTLITDEDTARRILKANKR
jgi:DNA-binding transcriptional regulator LsrR (DeoR family)